MQKRIEAYYVGLGERFFGSCSTTEISLKLCNLCGSYSSVEEALRLCDLYGFKSLDELILKQIDSRRVEINKGGYIDPVSEVHMKAMEIAEDELLDFGVDIVFMLNWSEQGYSIRLFCDDFEKIDNLDSSKFSPLLKTLLEQVVLVMTC
ncbi:hypothetical protein DMB95_08740 [Campylobacter sp. MIT 12-8780]|uniref:hypothetical protein n=1 Tax=unclassified Campylobacter TaxID=2593542 RepID=UPI00115EE815|nr:MULTISPECIES: hypothetical protein [unclassified Campylobacter]NDJ27961.1 hypothetical protein [Campylobacter sp. MIT 19-121]TQR40107.1 hypothetical protein DMB95_08740 [Campylobacter sp. MIT 12-8780]